MRVNSHLQKKAFTLIELIIVIIIMGVVYKLAIVNFNKVNDESKKLTLLNLKEYLAKLPYKKSSELLCLDDCSTCKVMVDGNVTQELEDFLDESVKIYRYDTSYGAVEKEMRVYFNSEDVEQNVCFDYKVFANGVGDQIFVEYKNRFYDFTTYFEKTAVYDSMEALIDAKEAKVSEVKNDF